MSAYAGAAQILMDQDVANVLRVRRNASEAYARLKVAEESASSQRERLAKDCAEEIARLAWLVSRLTPEQHAVYLSCITSS